MRPRPLRLARAWTVSAAAAIVASASGLVPGPALAQSALKPAEQHVTVPTAPGVPNRQEVVRPSGTMRTDDWGWVRNGPAPSPATWTGSGSGCGDPGVPGLEWRTVSAPGPSFPRTASLQKAQEPLPSPMATGPNHATVRGVVKSVEEGKSLSVTLPTGRTMTYALAWGTPLPAGLRAGETVRLRLLLFSDGRPADRVERVVD